MSKYSKMWEAAYRVENLGQLQRTWRIHMKPWLLFFWFRNVKIIKRNTGTHRNKAWGRLNWGSFWIFIAPGWACLYYMWKGNNWLTRRILDHIRICPDGTIIGKFHIRLFGRPWFLSWFTMERVGSSMVIECPMHGRTSIEYCQRCCDWYVVYKTPNDRRISKGVGHNIQCGWSDERVAIELQTDGGE